MNQETQLPQEELIPAFVRFVIKTLLLVILAAALVAAIVALMLLGSFDTEYAPRYSERAFRSIRIGATEESVLSRLGPPLASENSEPYIEWIYSSEKQPTFSENGVASGTYTTVTFDRRGQVKSVSGQRATSENNVSIGETQNYFGLTNHEIEILKGSSQDQVRQRFGSPAAVHECKASKVLAYSRSPSSSNYRLRKLGLDDQGRVVHIWNCIYWD
jgi:outer membrane protein assembly factor BamE (lipoprotein component of BamABCDE complex)